MKTETVSHTPGPWRRRGQTITGGEVTIQDGIKGTVICLFGDMWKGDAERTANACLIEACPDLLEAAKEWHDNWLYIREHYPDIELPFSVRDGADSFGRLRVAIAKAEPCDS